TDAKNIGDVDNAFSSEFNASINPMEFLCYFKESLWDSAAWAAADCADAPVNGENFEFASFTFTADPGAVITVTGELRFGDVTVPVSTSFVLGSSVAEPTTQKPKPTEPSTEPKTTEPPAPVTTTHPSYRPLNENGPVAFTLTGFEGTDAVISASFIDCVGIESGQLTFTSSNNTLQYVGCSAGADAGKVSKSENKFTYDTNDSIPNRIDYGFYFQENLWDSATWATAKGVEGEVNAERFAFASFQFTLAPGTVVTVTGKLKDINGNERTVNESFQIGEAPTPELPTRADDGLYDSFGNKILGYDKYGQAIIGYQNGQLIYSPDPSAHTHSHIYSGVTVTAPACTEPGQGEWVCDICGYVSGTYTIDPTGHNPDNGRVTKPATCKEEGEMAYTCYICGQVVRTESIPKPKEHQWDIGKVTKASTATAEGEITYTCKSCGDTKKETTPKLAVAETGSCGDKVTYTLWNSGLLEIAGSGPMTDYAYGEAPWFKKDTVRDVKIGKGVTTVPEGAFSQCKNLQSVTVPDGVTEIVYAAFSLCPGLETVALPKTVKTIGENAFYGCDGLQKIALPENVKTIGDYAFMSCDELTEVGLPKKLETVGKYAFAYNEKLETLTPPAGVTDVGYDAFNRTAWYTAQPEGIVYFGKVLYKYKGTPQPVSGKVPAGYEAGVMPEGTELTVKAGTVRIADYAFQNCNGLVGLTLPEGLLSIGRYALYSCRNLAKVNFPDSIASIGDDALPYYLNWPWFQSQPDGMVYVGKIAYRYKGEMKPGAALTLKDGTTQIYSEAFYEQTNLKKITIPESVTEIGYHAFTRCSSLESVRVPKAVTVIQSNTFAGCASLREAVLPEGLKTIEYYAFQGCEKLEQIALPDSLTDILSGAFRDCAALKEITIPKNVATLSDSAFAGCSSLERGAVHADNPVYYSEGDCVIEKETKAVVLGGSASVLPDGVTAIVYNAFSGRTALKEIAIPSSVKSLNGFSGCTGLTAITIPDGVTEIGRYAFSDCTGLTGELVIPNSVTSLGYEAFYRCAGLTGVRLSDNLTAIEDNAFSRCSGLTSVAIPAKVERIGYAAFGYCDGLTEVKIPGNVKTIEWDAFEHCRNLASVTIEDGVETIGGYAFYGCDSLAGINIPASVTFIGDNAIPAHTVIYGKPGSYAETWAKENNRAFVVLDEAYLTMYTAPVVNVPTAEAYGFATPGAQVKLTLNGKKAATVTAAGSGRWSAALPLKGAKDGGSFTLKAEVTFNKKTVSAEETVIYRPNAVVFKEFELRHSYYSATVNEKNLSVTVPNFTIVPGYPFAFRVAVSNSDRIGKLWVVSTENGVSKKMALTYNEVTGQWFSGEGFFADTDRYYVPGVFTVEGVDKEGKAFDCGVTIRFRFLIDPSGYVYEAVQSNKIEGATVSVYYKDADGRELLWNAAEAGQTNPITTLADGAFAWDVPKGQWQVQVTKSGYETARSDWMDVPPEWKNVFLALVSSENPTVKALNLYADHADVIFSAYMDIDSVNTDTVVFEGYTGKIAPVDKTETAEKSGVFYASAFRFTPDKPFAGEVKVKLQAAPVKEEADSGKVYNEAPAANKPASAKPTPVKTDGGKKTDGEPSPWTMTSGYSGIQNYAGKPLYACEGTFQVTAEPKNLSVEKTVSVVYGQTAEIVVSAENAAGKTVAVSCDNANAALSAKALTLDENGKATLTVTGEMPGTVKLTFTLEGTALTAETEATVELPEPETPDVKMGDVDGDGELTSGDARLALRASVKLETYEEGSAAYIAADVDRNGAIESSDARLILRASVKLEDPTKW
ncbi:MAG: leucine-rich repeat protein, partial [Clostridia bacterium]|nr:leucine-rich repeat protein [Clostridia bacterium]